MRPLLLVVLAACTGTISSPGGSGDPSSPDAGTSSTPSGGGSGSASGSGSGNGSGSGTSCKTLVTANLVSGHHNAGQDCLHCHDGATAPQFTLAGTLYQAGGAAQAGGTITVLDNTGTSVDLVSGTNGNFYTSAALVFPVTVTASGCPSTMQMASKVSAGGCATAGCHVSGAQGPIHL